MAVGVFQSKLHLVHALESERSCEGRVVGSHRAAKRGIHIIHNHTAGDPDNTRAEWRISRGFTVSEQVSHCGLGAVEDITASLLIPEQREGVLAPASHPPWGINWKWDGGGLTSGITGTPARA